MASWLWAVFTVIAALSQTFRNAAQRELTGTLGTAGATHVRFLFGLPFAILFLLGVVAVTGLTPPALTGRAVGSTLVGAFAQIAGTALMLAAMKKRSFVVTTAYAKTEPVQVALFGLVLLGDRLTLMQALAILLATLGVVVMSWPKGDATKADATKAAIGPREGPATPFAWLEHPVTMGLGCGGMLGLSAVCYRGAILALGAPGGAVTPATSHFIVKAATVLVLALFIQTIALTLYLAVRERHTLSALAKAWRPSVWAGFLGAFASFNWFLAFAIESAARVRTLALIEILFAQAISRSLFKQSASSQEGIGIALIVIGVVWLLNV